MPTSPAVNFSGRHLVPVKDPDSARKDVIHLANGTYLAGTVVGEVASPGGTYKAYASGNVDGSQYPTHVLEYDCIFSGGVGYLGDTAGGEWRASELGVPAYRNGIFDCDELTGLDTNAVSALNARLIQGDVNTGRVLIPG